MGEGRFINQKLGKRTSRRMNLEKARLAERPPAGRHGSSSPRIPKKGFSRERPGGARPD